VVQQNQSFADIYAAADQLLYSSKKNGKGRDVFPEQRGE
jgi:PleD family two-component response regulator